MRGWGECVCERVGEGREGKGRKVYMSVCACVEVGCIVSEEGRRRWRGGGGGGGEGKHTWMG